MGFALIRSGAFGLGLRAGATGFMVITPEGESAGTAALTPGLVATVRGDRWALSVGADAPMYLAGYVLTPSVSGAASGFFPSLRPSLALEIGGAGDATKFYLRQDATFFLDSAASGAFFASTSIGFHF